MSKKGFLIPKLLNFVAIPTNAPYQLTLALVVCVQWTNSSYTEVAKVPCY